MIRAAAALVLSLIPMAAAAVTPADLIAGYAAEAGIPPSPDRGRAFYLAVQTGGKPDTPSCTTCHTADPKAMGRTRAGKDIEPMAVSASPKRFTDLAFAEKWFTRNCDSVLARPCTAAEKADFIAWLAGQ